jgi:hypothetical protein
MNISDCIDNERIPTQKAGNHSTTLVAQTKDEMELIDSISKFLYKTKSIRNMIDILDRLSSSEYIIEHSFPPKVIFNYSERTNEEILEDLRTPYSDC